MWPILSSCVSTAAELTISHHFCCPCHLASLPHLCCCIAPFLHPCSILTSRSSWDTQPNPLGTTLWSVRSLCSNKEDIVAIMVRWQPTIVLGRQSSGLSARNIFNCVCSGSETPDFLSQGYHNCSSLGRFILVQASFVCYLLGVSHEKSSWVQHVLLGLMAARFISSCWKPHYFI